MTVRDRDTGWKRLSKAMTRPKETSVLVGVFGDEGDNERQGAEITNVELATIHEFGAKYVPQRSFIRAGIDKSRGDLGKLVEKLFNGVITGKFTAEQALELLGEQGVAEVRKYVRDGDGVPPPLAASTVNRKGSSRPLVDTGQLVQSITHRVGEEGEGCP